MPITLTISEGMLSAEAQTKVFASLTETLLEVNGLTDNSFMQPNVVGTINALPKGHVFANGRPADAAFIELKLPSIALVTAEAKQQFIERATTVVEQAAGGRIRREHIWTNIVYAEDGSWGIGGRGYSNAALVGAIQDAANRTAVA